MLSYEKRRNIWPYTARTSKHKTRNRDCHFLKKSECTGDVRFVGKAVNRGGGYGMEVPCVYRFMGPEKYVQRLKSLLDIDNNLSVRYTSQTEEAMKHKRAHDKDASSSGTKKSKR